MPRPSTPSTDDLTALGAAIEAFDGAGAVRKSFIAIPFGNPIQGRDGRQWVMPDPAAAQRVVDATLAFLGKTEMALNYDHQPELAVASGAGGKAPASGWVKRCYVGQGGVCVDVEWTPAAESAIASREYRYISPSFQFDKKTGIVTRLNNVALTNNPNLDLPALAHAGQRPEGVAEDMKTITLAGAAMTALAAALAVKPEELDEAKILEGIGQLKTDRDAAVATCAAVRGKLALAEDADEATVLASIDSAKAAGDPDPSKFVPKAGYDELAGRLKSLEEDKVLASVDAAVEGGKIAPAMKDWAIALGKKDPAALNSYLEQAVPFGGSAQIKGDGKPKKGELTEDERAICAQLGLTEAAYLLSRDGETEEAK